jgi:hypothetical protein
MPPALFTLVILKVDSCFGPRPFWAIILLFYASCHILAPKMPSFFPLRWGLASFVVVVVVLPEIP